MRDIAAKVRVAARALGRAGLVHAYGHCSARLDRDSFLVCPARPMAHIEVDEPCPSVPVDGELPEGVLGEVRIHQQIYRSVPEAGGVVRFMGPSVMALSPLGLVPRMRHGFGAYFHAGIGLWDDVQLVRNEAAAAGVVAAMGPGRAVLMRGNGAVVYGESLEEAVVLAWYLEDACRVELAALAAGFGDGPELDPDEARARAVKSGRIIERMWDFLTHSDPELAKIRITQ